MNNCPFCHLTIAHKAFAELDGNIAVYNISPILEGHSLIIPVKHYESLFEMTEDEISSFFSFARKVTAFLCEIYEADAWDWSLQEGEEAGQSVKHLHLHIIPRKPSDLKEGEEWYQKLRQQQFEAPDNNGRHRLSETDYSKISEHLRNSWKKH